MTEVEAQEAAIGVSSDEAGHILGSAERPVVVVERTLKATPADVWSAWTDPETGQALARRARGSARRARAPDRMAMTASELPADLDDAEFLATLTVLESVPPSGDGEGRLVFTFDDQSDPGGHVTVTMGRVGTGSWTGWRMPSTVATMVPDERYEVLFPHYQARMRQPSTPAGLGGWLADVVDGTFGPDQRVVLVCDENAPETSPQDSVVTEWDPPRRLVPTWDFSGRPRRSAKLGRTGL